MMLVSILLLTMSLVQAQHQAFDGSDQTSGRINTPLHQHAPNAYEDRISVPRMGSNGVSARLVSNKVFGRFKGSTVLNHPENTALTIFFGQFLDHDMSITLFNGPDACAEEFNIAVPTGDARFDPEARGGQQMHFCRSDFIAGSGTSTQNYRRHANAVTPHVDASMVYGETPARAALLRSRVRGMMKTSVGRDGAFPPVNVDPQTGGPLMSMINDAARVPNEQLYATGDLRGNEQPVLLALHTLFLREHNRRAQLIGAAEPTLSDEEIFQRARRWVIGHIQAIMVNEWFPAFVGGSLGPYRGYSPSVDSQIDIFFSTAALRVGHDGIPGIVLRLDSQNREIAEGHLNLRDGFFLPEATKQTGITATLRGASMNPSQLMDAIFSDDIRDHLFSMERALATDLGARNLQRGRDHGVADYNTMRRAYGLSECPAQDFNCVAEDPEIAQALRELFNTTNLLDPYVAGLSERKRSGQKIGELFATAITEQLDRLRHGDRFWYEHLYAPNDVVRKELEATTLGDIIRRNTGAYDIPRSVFTRDETPVTHTSATRINFLFDGIFE